MIFTIYHYNRPRPCKASASPVLTSPDCYLPA